MENLEFDYPINTGNKLHGTLHVESHYDKGEVEIDCVKYSDSYKPNRGCHFNGAWLAYPPVDVTALIENWAEGLWESLQEAAEHNAYESGLKVDRLDDPRETELRDILKP